MKSALLGLLLLCLGGTGLQAVAQPSAVEAARVIVESGDWELVGDLVLPSSEAPLPVVLMLNQAAGDRTPYAALARHLAARGIASLRLDLRGHGESTNRGAFVPGEQRRDPLIWDAEVDVTAAHAYLRTHPQLDGTRIGIVGASYSGEEMAEAGRTQAYAQAYVALSPGSFSEASVQGIDASGVPWLFISAKEDRFLQDITALLQAESETVERVLVPGRSHATNMLEVHPDMAERIAVWLAQRLGMV